MIRISLKGLAKFITSNPSQQRKILRDFKYPDPEGGVQAVYYAEARDAIVKFHKNMKPKEWLEAQAQRLSEFAAQSDGRARARHRHNAVALYDYKENFGGRQYTVLQPPRIKLTYSGVIISATPDMYVEERGRQRLIKFEFNRNASDPRLAKIVTQAMYEAQAGEGIGLPSSAVLYLNIHTGETTKAQTRSRLQQEIEDACQNIAALWDGITR